MRKSEIWCERGNVAMYEKDLRFSQITLKEGSKASNMAGRRVAAE
jgi:hypothetical protein